MCSGGPPVVVPDSIRQLALAPIIGDQEHGARRGVDRMKQRGKTHAGDLGRRPGPQERRGELLEVRRLPELAIDFNPGVALGERLLAKVSNRQADQQADEREQKQRCGVAPVIRLKPVGRAGKDVRAGEGSADRREKARPEAAEPRRDNDHGGQCRQGESLAEERLKEVLGGGSRHTGDDCHRVTGGDRGAQRGSGVGVQRRGSQRGASVGVELGTRAGVGDERSRLSPDLVVIRTPLCRRLRHAVKKALGV